MSAKRANATRVEFGGEGQDEGEKPGRCYAWPPHPTLSPIEPQSLGSTREREHKMRHSKMRHSKTRLRRIRRACRFIGKFLAGASGYGEMRKFKTAELGKEAICNVKPGPQARFFCSVRTAFW